MSKRGAHSIERQPDSSRTRFPHRAGAPSADARHGKSLSRKRLVERIALCALGAAFAAFVVFSIVAPPPQQMQDGASQQLQDVMAKVDHANTHVAAMSELLANGLDDGGALQAESLLAQQDAIDNELLRAGRHLNALGSILSTDDRRAAKLLEQGIESRRDMLAYGMPVLKATLQAYELAPKVQDLWRCLLDGHSALSASAAQIEIGTTPAVEKALASDKQAKAAYERALQLMDEIGQTAPGYAFETERAYASKQVEAASEAMAADQALLDGKTEEADQHMSAYQNAAEQAAHIAESLPPAADDLLKRIYYSLGTENLSIADAESAYAEAAQRTSDIDSELATYRTSERQTP